MFRALGSDATFPRLRVGPRLELCRPLLGVGKLVLQHLVDGIEVGECNLLVAGRGVRAVTLKGVGASSMARCGEHHNTCSDAR